MCHRADWRVLVVCSAKGNLGEPLSEIPLARVAESIKRLDRLNDPPSARPMPLVSAIPRIPVLKGTVCSPAHVPGQVRLARRVGEIVWQNAVPAGGVRPARFPPVEEKYRTSGNAASG